MIQQKNGVHFLSIIWRWSDRLDDVLHDEGERREPTDDEKICDGTLKSMSSSHHSISFKLLPDRFLRLVFSVGGSWSVESVWSVQLFRVLDFVHLRYPSRLLRQIGKEFTKGFVFQVEFVAFCGELSLVVVRRFDWSKRRTFFEHEGK